MSFRVVYHSTEWYKYGHKSGVYYALEWYIQYIYSGINMDIRVVNMGIRVVYMGIRVV